MCAVVGSCYASARAVLPLLQHGAWLRGCIKQVVDLQEDERFRRLNVELLSIAPDRVEAWRDEGRAMGIREFETVLSDEENQVARRYGVMRWAAATGEPGHTFVLVDEGGQVAWLQDYGAPEHGGIMYVLPKEIVRMVGASL